VIARKIWTVFVGAWVGAWFARALFDWVIGAEGAVLVVATVLATAAGAWGGWEAAKELEPLTIWDRRDAFLGWGALIGVVAVCACFLLPLPWGVLAAAAVAAVTIAVLRRAPSAPPR
jgi:NhaP-type Na+/H+ or K+/H+ antiporter